MCIPCWFYLSGRIRSYFLHFPKEHTHFLALQPAYVLQFVMRMRTKLSSYFL
jgi:hypothetical protein